MVETNLLLTVEDTFELERGLCVTPLLLSEIQPTASSEITVLLSLPNGSERDAQAMLQPTQLLMSDGKQRNFILLIFQDIEKAEIPLGTLVYSDDNIARSMEVASETRAK